MKSESKIICKYFILGKCIKGEKCPYLHSQFKLEQDEISDRECPMYSIGYCKNGSMCKFIHIKKDSEGNEIKQSNIEIINSDDDSSTPYDGDSVTISYHEEKEVNNNNKKEEPKESKENKIIPIWYLEHYYDKPISAIFDELERQKLPEIEELQKKYDYNIKDNKINMNLNFNNFDMNLAFNNYYSFNFPINNILNEQYPSYLNNNYNSYFYNSNPYMSQIDYIEYLINNYKTYYHLVKFKNNKYIEDLLETNQIVIPYKLFIKYRYKSYFTHKIIIIIIYNIKDEEFSGFAKLEYPLKKEKKYAKPGVKFKINWLWNNGIKYSEVSHLVNKADQNHFLCEGRDWCPIHPDLGNYMCRLMLKRLNPEEIFELINEKQIFKQRLLFEQYYNKKTFKDEESLEEYEFEDDSDKNKDNDYSERDYSNKKLYQEDYYSDIDSEKTIFKGQKRKRYYNEY